MPVVGTSKGGTDLGLIHQCVENDGRQILCDRNAVQKIARDTRSALIYPNAAHYCLPENVRRDQRLLA
jgi:hypothetical protein